MNVDLSEWLRSHGDRGSISQPGDKYSFSGGVQDGRACGVLVLTALRRWGQRSPTSGKDHPQQVQECARFPRCC